MSMKFPLPSNTEEATPLAQVLVDQVARLLTEAKHLVDALEHQASLNLDDLYEDLKAAEASAREASRAVQVLVQHEDRSGWFEPGPHKPKVILTRHRNARSQADQQAMEFKRPDTVVDLQIQLPPKPELPVEPSLYEYVKQPKYSAAPAACSEMKKDGTPCKATGVTLANERIPRCFNHLREEEKVRHRAQVANKRECMDRYNDAHDEWQRQCDALINPWKQTTLSLQRQRSYRVAELWLAREAIEMDLDWEEFCAAVEVEDDARNEPGDFLPAPVAPTPSRNPWRQLQHQMQERVQVQPAELTPGRRVAHDSYGVGTVVNTEGEGDKTVAYVDFKGEGIKRLLVRYAPLVVLVES